MMFIALFIGSAMMIGSLAIAILLFGVAARMLHWFAKKRALGYLRCPLTFASGFAGLWILFVLTTSVCGWAVFYITLGSFDHLESAFYFSIASFTAVGYGDVVLEPGWRLLVGLKETHGLLTFGLFTVFLVEVFNFPTRARRP